MSEMERRNWSVNEILDLLGPFTTEDGPNDPSVEISVKIADQTVMSDHIPTWLAARILQVAKSPQRKTYREFVRSLKDDKPDADKAA